MPIGILNYFAVVHLNKVKVNKTSNVPKTVIVLSKDYD